MKKRLEAIKESSESIVLLGFFLIRPLKLCVLFPNQNIR